MNTITGYGLLSLSLLLCATSGLEAQGVQDIRGTWQGISPKVRGERILIEEKFATINRNRLPLRHIAPGRLLLGPAGDQAQVSYQLEGQRLSLDYLGEQSSWRRLGVGQADTATESEAAADRPRNPLAGRAVPAADPFLRRFSGPGIDLQLRKHADGYRGKLDFQGQSYPARASAQGQRLEGSFQVGAQAFPFHAELRGDQLQLHSGGRKYQLRASAAATGRPLNPLAKGSPRGPGEGSTTPRSLTAPPGSRAFVDQTAGIACYLPKDWTLTQQSAQGLAINPGYKRGERMLCSVGLVASAVDPGSRKRPVEELLAAELADFRKSLAAHGVQIDLGAKRSSSFRVAGGQAAAIQAPARTSAGLKGSVWLALRIDGGTALACSAVYMQGAEARLGAKVRAVFASLRPASKAQDLGR